MGGQRRRSPLGDITHGRHAVLKRSMACEESDFDLPVVDPAELSVPGDKKPIPFTTSQMVALAEMRGANDEWRKLVQELSGREGTMVDVSEDILGYEDQASLREAREGPLRVEATHVMAALRGHASWPAFVGVECWLRDAIQVEQTTRHRVAAVKLWCLCIAKVSSPEAARWVVEATVNWAAYNVDDAQCSGKGSDMVATVAWKRAMMYKEWMWTVVMLASDRMSSEVLWDWRKFDRSCHTHAKLECVFGVGGQGGMDELPHQSMVPGGYSGNSESLAGVVDEEESAEESDDESDTDVVENLIDFEIHENSMGK